MQKSRTSINWDDYKIMLAVARGGSLSAAARTLRVNQTTVSRRLTTLEEQLGAQLFLRSRVACLPTEAGELLLERAERMEAEVVAISEEVEQVAHQPFGQVRIATMSWLFNYLLVPSMPAFHVTHPGISIVAISGLRERHLGRREAEMALRFEATVRSTEVSITVGDFASNMMTLR